MGSILILTMQRQSCTMHIAQGRALLFVTPRTIRMAKEEYQCHAEWIPETCVRKGACLHRQHEPSRHACMMHMGDVRIPHHSFIAWRSQNDAHEHATHKPSHVQCPHHGLSHGHVVVHHSSLIAYCSMFSIAAC